MAAALQECRWYLAEPGPVLPEPFTGCDCCNPILARDLLQAVLLWLPAGGRADLGRVVARLDAEFDRRAVPCPGLVTPDSPWGVDGPWRDQLMTE
ncbi:hypothetical protein LO772_14530 [Yinghuangia sp. ASG 101]|uniref:hypothetical protein n=1 Tax=Yinghuangia sp. ASG 101 TaxID=2896848 RepID=UPI001E604D20|nr:hypothetical protein [Yinghuangia sp. ASG 101]UGQ14685.1 hypothetical protein LO772_14530 [Yinghuangia sp. ASG 101]